MKHLINKLSAFLVMLVLVSAKAWAQEVNYNGLTYQLYTSETYDGRGDGVKLSGAVLTDINGMTGTINVSPYIVYDGAYYPVVGISGRESVFFRNNNVTKVFIPGSVRCIEDNTFCEMSNLKELEFGDGSEDLWMGCGTVYALKYQELTYYSDNLEKVTLGRNLVWNTDRDEPFEGKYKLKTIYITDGCTHIGVPGTVNNCRRLFNSCTEVENIIIEDSNKPLYVEYCGLYMKNSAAAWNQWKNIYIGRTVQYPGWDQTDTSAWGEGYSPFYALGAYPNIVIGNRAGRLGSYMFYNSYINKVTCMAESIAVNTCAFGVNEIKERCTFNDVVLDQERYQLALNNADVRNLIIKPSCMDIDQTAEWEDHSNFEKCHFDNFTVESSSTSLNMSLRNIGYPGCITRLYCYRNVIHNSERHWFTFAVSEEAIFDGECTTIDDEFLSSIPETCNATIRIGKSVKKMGIIKSQLYITNKPQNPLVPTVIFEAETMEELPESDSYNYLLGLGGSSYSEFYEMVPVYLHCSIDRSKLSKYWNMTKYYKWHPEGQVTKGTKDTTTGLYSTACVVCNTPDDTHWMVDKWNGKDDLLITKDDGKYTYNERLYVSENEPLNIPVSIQTTGINWNRSVNGGDVQGVVFPFDVKYASYVNGSVYRYDEYDFENHMFNFRKVGGSAPLTAGTPYLVVLNENARKLLSVQTARTLIPTVNANGTPKEFKAGDYDVEFIGTFSGKETEHTYVYDSASKSFKLQSGTVVTDPFFASLKMDDELAEAVKIRLIDEFDNETILGNSLIPTGASVDGYVNAFDGSAFCKWSCDMPENGSPISVEFRTTEPMHVANYHFYTSPDNQNGERNPQSWTLYAKLNPQDAWETINVVEEGLLPRTAATRSADFNIDIEKLLNKYQYFKFEFTSVVKGSEFELGEICMTRNNLGSGDYLGTLGDESLEGQGVHGGRAHTIDPVTINGVTYTLFNDYYYIPMDYRHAYIYEQRRDIPGLSCVVTDCSNAEGDLIIPSSVEFAIGEANIRVPVRVLGFCMLRDANITSLSIPSSAVLAELSALSPLGVTSLCIGDSDQPLYFFNEGSVINYHGLHDLYIGRNLESTCEGIMARVSCTDLNVEFGNRVTAIQPKMFFKANGLKSIVLPETLLSVPASMCQDCIGLTSVEIPGTVTSIGADAFSGCTNITDYTILAVTPPTVDATSLSGTEDYLIRVPKDAVDTYLSKDDWKQYEPHFYIPVSENIVHHMPSEPTACERGFAQECWENPENGRIYSNEVCTYEITGLDLAKKVTYPKRYASPVTGNNGFNVVESDNVQTWGVQLNWAAEATFANTSSVKHDDRYVEFKAGDDYAGSARLVWMKNQGAPEQGRFTVNIYVNDVLKQTCNQNNNENMEGVVVVALPGLVKGDIVKFEVQQNSYASYAEAGPTFKACLEYAFSYGTILANGNPDEPGKYYTTYYDGRSAYSLPETAKAYTGTVTDDELILTPVEDNIIPMGEAVIIRSTSGNITLTPSDSDKQKNNENCLRGSDTDTEAPDGCYILSYGQYGLGFYRYAEGNTLAAHKAFLIIQHGALAKAFRMVFSDGDVNAIQNVSANKISNSAIYNLNGVRLDKLQKGINIVNGKKIFVK